MSSSWVVEYASRESNNNNHHEDGDEWSDLLRAGCDPTASNLSLPADALLRAAISLKDQVVEMTWRRRGSKGSLDPTVYTGLMGTAFTCLRSYEATGNHHDLRLCAEIVDACASAALSTRHVTFLCGRGGVYALGAIAANSCRDQKKRDFYLDHFLEMAKERALPVGPEEGGFGMSYDLLYGRAGFLWAALLVNKYLGAQTIPNDLLMPVVEAVVAGGRAGAADNTACPLMYRWHGTRYWGAAHGLAGILHVLLHFPLSGDDIEDVKATLRYMMSNRFPHSGNYPVSEGNPRDKLVQWSHGASGIAVTLCKASQVLPNDREFRNAAIEAGEVVWKNGLVKKVGLADGTAGNAYAFLSLLRLTGESIYEERAKAFASYLYHSVRKTMAEEYSGGGAENYYSLFHGVAGAACLWFDLLRTEDSRFPGYEL
ncbi:Lanthionine synthetase C-like protein 1 [Handroanthus impetiginosus]|uniref:Lanthionine synthetase C-like protein 1 n=1 Tax=Handroanthus impetiginosus TaxID=429701 RepID=A0A2G9GCQ4_9LAMI|nr:Lanthionine synthetase C-like protein 1 [Handroanthus impetiginosus]